MKKKFNHITFENPRHTMFFREFLNPFFEVPYAVAVNKTAIFNTEFIGKFNPVQVYAVSEQMTEDSNLIYQIVKPEIFKLTNPMLQMLFAPINMQDGVGDYLVKVHNVRAFVEVQDLSGEIPHQTEQKSLKALHVGGRDGGLEWEDIVEAVELFWVENIILESEVAAYMAASGYNVE
jgi:hypothetical protein